MKFIWRGKYTGPHQLPLGVLPEGAVQYQEPDTPEQLAKAAVPYSLWMLVLWLALGALKCLLWREWGLFLFPFGNTVVAGAGDPP